MKSSCARLNCSSSLGTPAIGPEVEIEASPSVRGTVSALAADSGISLGIFGEASFETNFTFVNLYSASESGY